MAEPQWEYTFVEFSAFGKGEAKMLNDMGQRGWELVSSVTVTFLGCTVGFTHYFKRPANPTTEDDKQESGNHG